MLGADPTEDVAALRHVRDVYFGGERVDRDALLTTDPGQWLPRNPEE